MEALKFTARQEIYYKLISICPGKEKEISEILDEYDIQERNIDEGKDLRSKIRIFLAAKKLEGISQSTSDSYTIELRIFSSYMHKATEDITAPDIRTYLGQFTELKNSSISTKLSCLKSFFGWMTDNEYIPKDPTRLIKPPKKEKRLPKALTIPELEMVREACQTTRQKALVEVLYSTGCRLSEIVAMNRRDIDLSNSSARVIGKGDKERIVYFSWKAIHYLQKYFESRTDDDLAMFVTERKPHRRLMDRSVQREIDKIASRTGIDKKMHPHIFRHTLATLMLNNGADIVVVQRILGHENPATTQNYAVLSEQRKEEAYRKYMVQ